MKRAFRIAGLLFSGFVVGWVAARLTVPVGLLLMTCPHGDRMTVTAEGRVVEFTATAPGKQGWELR